MLHSPNKQSWLCRTHYRYNKIIEEKKIQKIGHNFISTRNAALLNWFQLLLLRSILIGAHFPCVCCIPSNSKQVNGGTWDFTSVNTYCFKHHFVSMDPIGQRMWEKMIGIEFPIPTSHLASMRKDPMHLVLFTNLVIPILFN